jgi:hypothetical protein
MLRRTITCQYLSTLHTVLAVGALYPCDALSAICAVEHVWLVPPEELRRSSTPVRLAWEQSLGLSCPRLLHVGEGEADGPPLALPGRPNMVG